MGALSSMFAAASGGNRRNKSLSSTSLNSSQEQEKPTEGTNVTEDFQQQQDRLLATGAKQKNEALKKRSLESVVSIFCE